MGKTGYIQKVSGREYTSPLISGTVELYDSNNNKLLIATYSGAGSLDSIWLRGTAGQLDLAGVYNITGGQLVDLGLISGSLYVTASLDNVTRMVGSDISAKNAEFRFYVNRSGSTEVPELGSVILLLSGAVGARRISRRKLM